MEDEGGIEPIWTPIQEGDVIFSLVEDSLASELMVSDSVAVETVEILYRSYWTIEIGEIQDIDDSMMATLGTSLSSAGRAALPDLTILELQKKNHVGDIGYGEEVTFQFMYSNIGDAPVTNPYFGIYVEGQKLGWWLSQRCTPGKELYGD